MTTLILTVAGADRPGLVSTVADIVDAHGGNWENSQLAELAGTFAGVIQISVAGDRVAALRTDLDALEGMLSITVHTGAAAGAGAASVARVRRLEITVLGDDRPGIVREISGVLSTHALSIEKLTTHTRDAAMAGGRLFESTMIAAAPAGVDLDALRDDIERLTHDLQVEIAADDRG